MVTDYSTLEKLYARGVLDINGKDYLTGSVSNIKPNSNLDTFLPDSRFVKVDGNYMRGQIDRDMFQPTDKEFNPSVAMPAGQFDVSENSDKKDIKTKLKELAGNKVTMGIVGSLALLCSAKYLLGKCSFVKSIITGCGKSIKSVIKWLGKK